MPLLLLDQRLLHPSVSNLPPGRLSHTFPAEESNLIEYSLIDSLCLKKLFGLRKIDKQYLSLNFHVLVTLHPSDYSGLGRNVLRELTNCVMTVLGSFVLFSEIAPLPFIVS